MGGLAGETSSAVKVTVRKGGKLLVGVIPKVLLWLVWSCQAQKCFLTHPCSQGMPDCNFTHSAEHTYLGRSHCCATAAVLSAAGHAARACVSFVQCLEVLAVLQSNLWVAPGKEGLGANVLELEGRRRLGTETSPWINLGCGRACKLEQRVAALRGWTWG